MFDWAGLYLMELIVLRMTGFIMFGPIYGRTGIPGLIKGGLIGVLSLFVISFTDAGTVEVPVTMLEIALKMFLELSVGAVVGYVMRLFFMVVQFGGEIVDAQMGLTMAQTYDAGSQMNMSVTGSLLNILLVLNFFAENGHYTLMRILLASAELLPYGQVSMGTAVSEYVMELFVGCLVFAVKLSMPILAAEMLGQLGMGILMKAIPQINAFVINMELKVIVGLALLFFFLVPMNEFILKVEMEMLGSMQQMLVTIAGAG